jgi:hypothetical protein
LEKDIPSKWSTKHERVAILISDKAEFKQKLVRREKECHFTLIKRIIHKEDNICKHIHTIGEPNFIKQTLLDLKPGIDPNIIILNDSYKTEHLFMIKALNKPVNRRNAPQHNKGYTWQTCSQHHTKWKKNCNNFL